MTAFRRVGFAVALLMLGACNQEAATATAKGKQVAAKAIAGRDWTKLVSETPDGGYLMGNPAAKVKLVEYGSLTCPHCAAFSRESAPLLINDYVKPGLVSYEFRNFARDPLDLAAAVMLHCVGSGASFKLIDQLYADQDQWLGKLEKASAADSARLNALPPDKAMGELVKFAGLDRFFAMRGLPSARGEQCLADKNRQQKIAGIRATAVQKFEVDGTPTFIINGAKAANTYDYTTLKPRLDEALGS
jgi:protein-disulfide isomerase